MKKLIILSMVAMFAGACGPTAESACEDLKDTCEGDKTYGEAVKGVKCEDAQKDYDDSSDAEKEASDKIIDCIDEAEDCTTKMACMMAGEAAE